MGFLCVPHRSVWDQFWQPRVARNLLSKTSLPFQCSAGSRLWGPSPPFQRHFPILSRASYPDQDPIQSSLVYQVKYWTMNHFSSHETGQMAFHLLPKLLRDLPAHNATACEPLLLTFSKSKYYFIAVLLPSRHKSQQQRGYRTATAAWRGWGAAGMGQQPPARRHPICSPKVLRSVCIAWPGSASCKRRGVEWSRCTTCDKRTIWKEALTSKTSPSRMRQLKQSRPSWVSWPLNLSSCSQTKLISVREDKCCLQSSDKNEEICPFLRALQRFWGLQMESRD